MTLISLTDLHDLASRVLVAAKTSPENAAAVARALVKADADGIPSHGVSRLPAYADQAKAGKVDGFANPDVSFPVKASIRVDARSCEIDSSPTGRPSSYIALESYFSVSQTLMQLTTRKTHALHKHGSTHNHCSPETGSIIANTKKRGTRNNY